jgi:hypothetical protein
MTMLSASAGSGAAPNSRADLEQRARAGQLAWSGPLVMVLARTVLAFAAQGLVAALYAARANPQPWLAAAPWFTVTGTLVDLGCLALLAGLTRREGLGLGHLLGPSRASLARDLLVALGLVVLLMGVGIAAGAVVTPLLYGPGAPPPRIFGPLPPWAALYSVVVWPVVWAVAEQMTYSGYAAPRLQALAGRMWVALLVTNIGYGLQHIALPSLPDVRFMLYRFLPAVAVGVTMTLVYLRLRRLRPLIFAHWVADVTSAVMFVLLPMWAQP